MTKKLMAAALVALLALAMAVSSLAAQLSTNVTIRFVERVEIDDLPIPLSDGLSPAEEEACIFGPRMPLADCMD